MPGIANLRSDFHFDPEYIDGQVPLSENHLISDYENRRYDLAVAAGAGDHFYKRF